MVFTLILSHSTGRSHFLERLQLDVNLFEYHKLINCRFNFNRKKPGPTTIWITVEDPGLNLVEGRGSTINADELFFLNFAY